ncbi:hypothetical protein [Pontibacter anaerobius]|uniref:Uncharacterized protein n=1 Tax=Pontibacter anaerobius TaxID=2993940 RepID=A0ABT3REJ4_9BACT|nr:hypothetical protein [Pontibacter anaerobius]MCX2740044.1 hypothetical protein [Pontibacter anaerobius]
MKASPYAADYEAEIAVWPKPIQLTHPNGDVYLTLQLHPGYIEAKWYGHITASDVVTASKVYLALLQTYPCPDKLLNDKTNVTGDWSEANDWLEFEWLPQVIHAGLRCLSHIYSSNMFSRLSARDLYLRVTPRLQMQNFNDRNEGLYWLLTSLPPQLEQSA